MQYVDMSPCKIDIYPCMIHMCPIDIFPIYMYPIDRYPIDLYLCMIDIYPCITEIDPKDWNRKISPTLYRSSEPWQERTHQFCFSSSGKKSKKKNICLLLCKSKFYLIFSTDDSQISHGSEASRCALNCDGTLLNIHFDFKLFFLSCLINLNVMTIEVKRRIGAFQQLNMSRARRNENKRVHTFVKNILTGIFT
jgi:hypothetical protein